MATFMTMSASPVYRVHMQGFNAIERAVLGGLLHLADRNGTRFKMEAEAKDSDIFILDGSNQRSVAFGQSHAQIEPCAIWIDPPADLKPSRQIKRPFRWLYLLEMMEQVVRGFRKPATPAQRLPVMKNISFRPLCSLCEHILRSYVGVAAEFVVRDARAEMKVFAATNQQVSTNVFLNMLKKQLPANADADRILREISTAIARVNNAAHPGKLPGASGRR